MKNSQQDSQRAADPPGNGQAVRLVEANVQCDLVDCAAARQVSAMFALRPGSRARQTYRAEFPDEKAAWRIGLVVGPSGSGKTTLVRSAFGRRLVAARRWPADRGVVDCLGDLPVSQIAALFAAVGFGSVPSWLRPYRVLSGGERFRCDLARGLARALVQHAGPPPDIRRLPVVAFDEFSAALDRTAAQAACAALAKALRAGRIACRFVAVTCHEDVAEWLQPDWVLDTASGTLDWRRLRRPDIELAVFRCRHALWEVFAQHHYLSGSLNRGSRAFVAVWRQRPVAFCATLPLVGRRGRWRISRLVTLPDYQGIGIGTGLAEQVAAVHCEQGDRVSITAGHPSIVAHCARSAWWRLSRTMDRGGNRCGFASRYAASTGRRVTSFEYVGRGGSPAADHRERRR